MVSTTKKIDDQILIIFGASGDLTYRKLMPAIFDLYIKKTLPDHFCVLGVSRSAFTHEQFREKMSQGIRQFAHYKTVDEEQLNAFLETVFYLSINTDDVAEYARLKQQLQNLDKEYQTGQNHIFYLSTPPEMYEKIPQYLFEQGMTHKEKGFRRLIIEKPFGHDLTSAIALNRRLLDFFEEEQLYRIDHYLGKETVQNLLVTRFANGIYEPLWNRNYIQHVEVTAAESLGVGARGGYYDHAGALRDMVQNHLLQLVSLVAMEPPSKVNAQAIRYEKMKVFQALRPLDKRALEQQVIRGQYTESTIKKETLAAYRNEKGVDHNSRTETFFAMKLFIDNWRWAGVPFYLRTGKRLPTRVSEIVIHFKPAPNKLFSHDSNILEGSNQLILRIHPDEGILLKTGMKMPGNGYDVKTVNMDFHYSELDDHYIPAAYERLILDCMMGDNTLFMDGDALEETWRFVQPILDHWQEQPDTPLLGYPAGTWGPEKSDSLVEDKEQGWRYPCKNLSDDGIYCQL